MAYAGSYGSMNYGQGGGSYGCIDEKKDLDEKKLILKRRLELEKGLVQLRNEKKVLDRNIQSAINSLTFISISPSSPENKCEAIKTATMELVHARSEMKKKEEEISALFVEMKEHTLSLGSNIRKEEVEMLRSQMRGVSSAIIRSCVEKEIVSLESMSVEDWIEKS